MTHQFRNKSEEFVYQTARESFLSLWSYANPLGKHPGRELCDVLVVCDPAIIIFSVKEISVSKKDVDSVYLERWSRKAIESSCKQIYGAERYLTSAENVTKSDGTDGVRLPDKDARRVYRIAVALGGEGKTLIHSGDFGKGFVHVFDKISFATVLSELDTLSDFIVYLEAKESFCKSSDMVMVGGGEEDLLAFYLYNERTFPKTTNQLILVEEGIWEKFINEKQYLAKHKEDKISYVWDSLIEYLSKNSFPYLELGSSLSDIELGLRVMAKENRFSRRLLGKVFSDFLANKTKVRSRVFSSLGNVTYVFLAAPFSQTREQRVFELENRCYVARNIFPKNNTAVGIATESDAPIKGFSLDMIYFRQDEWTKYDRKKAKRLSKEFGLFAKPLMDRISDEEYPI